MMRQYCGLPFRLDDTSKAQLQQFYLEEEEIHQQSDSDPEEAPPICKAYVNQANCFVKAKPTPVRMYKDRQQLMHENRRLKKQYGLLLGKQEELEEKSRTYRSQCREIKEAISRISSILPKSAGYPERNLLSGKQSSLAKESQLRSLEQLNSLKKSSAATQFYELQAYYEELRSENEKLVASKNRLGLAKQQLLRKSDLTLAQQEQYSDFQQQLLYTTESRRLAHATKLRQSERLQECVMERLNENNITCTQNQIKQLKSDLAEAKFAAEGLQYQLETIGKYRVELPVLEKQLSQTVSAITQRQQKIQLLKRTLEDKSLTHQYMKKWTDELKERLEEKKQLQAQAKEKLQSKINQLNKQFEEWNSRYKTLLMEDQAIRHARRRTKDPPQLQSTKKQKVRGVKRYEVEALCKRISFVLTLTRQTIEEFADEIINGCVKVSEQDVHERLRELPFLKEEPNLGKLSRFMLQDSSKQEQSEELQADLFRIILINTIGRPISHEAYLANLETMTPILGRLYNNIRHEINGLNRVEHFDEDRLQQALNFLQVRVSQMQLRSICIRLFEAGDHIDRYSLLTLKSLFAKQQLQVQQVE